MLTIFSAEELGLDHLVSNPRKDNIAFGLIREPHRIVLLDLNFKYIFRVDPQCMTLHLVGTDWSLVSFIFNFGSPNLEVPKTLKFMVLPSAYFPSYTHHNLTLDFSDMTTVPWYVSNPL